MREVNKLRVIYLIQGKFAHGMKSIMEISVSTYSQSIISICKVEKHASLFYFISIKLK